MYTTAGSSIFGYEISYIHIDHLIPSVECQNIDWKRHKRSCKHRKKNQTLNSPLDDQISWLLMHFDAFLVDLAAFALGPEANLVEGLKRNAGVISVAENEEKALSEWKPGMIRPFFIEKVGLRAIEEVPMDR
jgi:hypothetical protein